VSFILPATLHQNRELLVDLARFSEALVSEAAIRRKYRELLSDDDWIYLASDERLIEMVEAEKVRRVRDGSFKREKSQQILAARGPDTLDKILSDEKISPRHKIEAVKVLDNLSGFKPQLPAADEDRIRIVINLGKDSSGQDERLVFDCKPKNTLGQDTKMIDATPAESLSYHTTNPAQSFEPTTGFEPAPIKRGRGRPKGSRNKPKVSQATLPTTDGRDGNPL
jgi:hypothetical protein